MLIRWIRMLMRIRIRNTAYYYSMTFQVALETLEGHQRAIMGSMTVEASTMLQCKERTAFCGWLRV
jgi:hypothetical protein